MQKIKIDILASIIKYLDKIYPKYSSVWGFSVHHIKSDQFIENARAVFEQVKSDASITKVIFTRDDSTEFHITDATNYIIVKLMSLRGILWMLKCKVLFVTHSIAMDYSFRYGNSKFTVLKLNMNSRKVINLWHGIPIKKLYALWNPEVRKRLDRVEYRRYERGKYAGLISTSTIDSYSMCAMFHPIKYENIWVIGLPKNDYLIKAINSLPTYLQEQITLIRNCKQSKRLILYAPTYRQTAAVNDSSYYQFSETEINELKLLLKKHNAIFGFRMHYFRNDKNLFNMESYVDNEFIFDLGHSIVPEIASVIRESDIVISDYSSVFIEALYVNKPVFGFTYDMEHYRDDQDGLLYDFDMIFPSPQVSQFSELLLKLDEELSNPIQTSTEKYKQAQKFFYNHIDTNNSERVVTKVKELLNEY
jgi:CDP-glycerol glycerophosphotransferase